MTTHEPPYPTGRDWRMEAVERRLEGVERELVAAREIAVMREQLATQRRDHDQLATAFREHVEAQKGLEEAEQRRVGGALSFSRFQGWLIACAVVASAFIAILANAGVFSR